MYGRTGEGGEREEKGTEVREGEVVQTTSTTAGIISAADTVGSNVLSVNSYSNFTCNEKSSLFTSALLSTKLVNVI